MDAINKTNRWKGIVNIENGKTHIQIVREQDNILIAEMNVSPQGLSESDALDLADQIIQDWNFSCDELEDKIES